MRCNWRLQQSDSTVAAAQHCRQALLHLQKHLWQHDTRLGLMHPSDLLAQIQACSNNALLLFTLQASPASAPQHQPPPGCGSDGIPSVYLCAVTCRCGSLPELCDVIQLEAPHFTHKSASHALHKLSIMCQAYFTHLDSANLASR